MAKLKIGDEVLVPVDAPDGNGILAFCRVVELNEGKVVLCIIERQSNYLEISTNKIYDIESDEEGDPRFGCSEDLTDEKQLKFLSQSEFPRFRSGTKLDQVQRLMIDAYNVHNKRQIIEMIAEKINVSRTYARVYYNKLLMDGAAPGYK